MKKIEMQFTSEQKAAMRKRRDAEKAEELKRQARIAAIIAADAKKINEQLRRIPTKIHPSLRAMIAEKLAPWVHRQKHRTAASFLGGRACA